MRSEFVFSTNPGKENLSRAVLKNAGFPSEDWKCDLSGRSLSV